MQGVCVSIRLFAQDGEGAHGQSVGSESNLGLIPQCQSAWPFDTNPHTASSLRKTPRYPIIKTDVTLNLTNTEQKPRLGRVALLALVDWVIKHRDRSVVIENHGVGKSSQGGSVSFDQLIGVNGTESKEDVDSRGDCE